MTDITHSSSLSSINLEKIRQPALIGLAGLLVGRLILQLNLYRIGFESLTADDFGRTLLAARWANSPQLVWDGFWLPFHLYLHGIALKLNWDLTNTPRIINIVVGLASIVLVYYLTLELFRSRRAAFISAALITVNPVHLWLSSTTLAELPQSALAFAAMLSFILYLKGRSKRYLYLSALALLLGNGFRYESWMISIVYSLYLGIDIIRRLWREKAFDRQIIHLGIAAVLPWLFPVAWMIGNYAAHGDFLFFLTVTRNYKDQWYGLERSFTNFWPWLKLIDPYTTILILFVIAITLWKNRKSEVVRWFILIAVAPFLLFLYLHGGQVDEQGNYLRYLAPFVIVFYPLMAYGINTGIKRVTSNSYLQLIGIGIIIGVIGLTQLRTTYQFVQALRGFEAGERIRTLWAEDEALAERPILIELVYWEYLAIHTGANDISPRILYDRPFDPDRASVSLFMSEPDTIRDCLASYNVSYLLLKSAEFIEFAQDTLGLTPIEQIEGYIFYKIPPDFNTNPAPACPFVLDSY